MRVMNGVHDMGGMQGYGAIPIEADEKLLLGFELRKFPFNSSYRLETVRNRLLINLGSKRESTITNPLFL